MGIFNHKFEINKENPFELDKLNREEEAIILTNMFSTVENQMVMAVSSPWGTGKTTFLNMWKEYLHKQDYSTIHFNCWKNDFTEDPFIAFVEEFRTQLDSSIISANFKEKAKTLGKYVVKNIPGMIIGYIKNKTDVDISEIISEEELEGLAKSKMDDYTNMKNSVGSFKEELSNLALENLNKTKKPLIVFVDELDRCNPRFAISLLERIKHFFNVENIIFVLGVDKDALSNSIKVVYGSGTDINGYLSRFIDLEYSLRQDYNKDYISYIMSKYNFESFFEKRENGSLPRCESDVDEFNKVVEEILSLFNFSLREVEKIITNLYLVVGANKDYYLYPYLLIFLMALKRYDKSLFNRVKMKSINVQELIEILDSKIPISRWLQENLYIGVSVEAYLIYILDDNYRIDEKRKLCDNIKENIYSNPYHRCVNVYDKLKLLDEYGDKDEMLRRTMRKIELYSQIY